MKKMEVEARVEVVWKSLDVNGTGSLSEAELAKAFTALGKQMSEKKLRNAFKSVIFNPLHNLPPRRSRDRIAADQIGVANEQMDKNGSGSIEYPEFLKWWRNQSAAERTQLEQVMDR